MAHFLKKNYFEQFNFVISLTLSFSEQIFWAIVSQKVASKSFRGC